MLDCEAVPVPAWFALAVLAWIGCGLFQCARLMRASIRWLAGVAPSRLAVCGVVLVQLALGVLLGPLMFLEDRSIDRSMGSAP